MHSVYCLECGPRATCLEPTEYPVSVFLPDSVTELAVLRLQMHLFCRGRKYVAFT